jgi:lipoprotein-releasing system ATP-binding protein
MSSPLASVRDVWKVFSKGGRQIEVLRGVSMEIQEGDRISIVGKSGSGKSTFMHLLGTLDRPTSGNVFFQEKDVFALPTRKIDALRNESIGFVFQFHHLLPDHDALHNIMLPMLISGASRAEGRSRASELLERVGLADRSQHKPGELSGGEQQRVAIARALVRRPKLLLADEPTGNLDPNTAEGIMGLLLDIQSEEGGALVVVTHDHVLAGSFPKQLTLADGRFVGEE